MAADIMQNSRNLSELEKGRYGIVLDISSNDSMRRRLRDLGFVNGARVSCVLVSPLGDPAAYLVCGAVIALRREDSSCVRIKVM